MVTSNDGSAWEWSSGPGDHNIDGTANESALESWNSATGLSTLDGVSLYQLPSIVHLYPSLNDWQEPLPIGLPNYGKSGFQQDNEQREPIPPALPWHVASPSTAEIVEKSLSQNDIEPGATHLGFPLEPVVASRDYHTNSSVHPVAKSSVDEAQISTPGPRQNVRESSNNYQCDRCSRSFARYCEFKKHMDRHSKPYACSVSDCSRTFGSVADLERHEQTVHHKQGLLLCGEPTCERSVPGKGFERKQHLKGHLERKAHRPPDTVGAPICTSSRRGKRKRMSEIQQVPQSPIAGPSRMINVPEEAEIEELKAAAAQRAPCYEKLLEEIESLKNTVNTYEEERKTLMDVIRHLTKD